jgi:crossover junction endodeoxyribonuclease RusA
VELAFPLEFVVSGTPVSFQAARAESKAEWKLRVRDASRQALPEDYFASEGRIAVTLFYFPAAAMQGDLDNIVKLVLDALSAHIYVDDGQVERILVQRFEPGNVFEFASPTAALADALSRQKPVLYVRISDRPFEELT